MKTVMGALIIAFISVGIYSEPYWIGKKDRDIEVCKSKGMVYYKPYKSEPICVKGEII